jgi:hypothetical protein
MLGLAWTRRLIPEVPAPEPESLSTAPTLRCEHCREVIGVYERLVQVRDGVARETSRAAEPDLSPHPGSSHYHADCFARVSVAR